MAKPNSIQPTLDLVQKTLKAAGRYGLSGCSQLPDGGQADRVVSGADPEYGWDNTEYSKIWSEHLSYLLRAHAKKPKMSAIHSNQPVNDLENVPFAVFHGWHDR